MFFLLLSIDFFLSTEPAGFLEKSIFYTTNDSKRNSLLKSIANYINLLHLHFVKLSENSFSKEPNNYV